MGKKPVTSMPSASGRGNASWLLLGRGGTALGDTNWVMPPQHSPLSASVVGGSPALRMAGIQMLLGCAAAPEKPPPLLPASLPSLRQQTLALLSGKERRIRLSWGTFGVF